MGYQLLVQTVQHRLGIEDAAAADRAVTATLEVLGECIHEPDSRRLRTRLPAYVADVLCGRPFSGDLDLDEFFGLVASREGVYAGFAAEHAEVVCRTVADMLDAEERLALRLHLPQTLQSLMDVLPADPPVSERRSRPGTQRRRAPRKLSSAKPRWPRG